MNKFIAAATLYMCCCDSLLAQDETGLFYDSRDGQEYETVIITVESDGVDSALEWMSSNLNYAMEDSKCYKNYKEYCSSFGRLYSWNAATTACPSGWHMSLDQEWKMIMKKYGTKIKAGPSLIEGGESNLNLQPAGFGEKGGEFIDVGVNGYYWKRESKTSTNPGTLTIHRGVTYVTDDKVDATHYNSIRCVKDY